MDKLANLRDDQSVMISDCISRESRMNEWERGFIQSISEYFDDGGFLSETQNEILERIWNRVTAKG